MLETGNKCYTPFNSVCLVVETLVVIEIDNEC